MKFKTKCPKGTCLDSPSVITKTLITWYWLCCCYFQGCGPTVTRAVVVNAAQLATYSQAKQALLSTSKLVVSTVI